MSLFAFGSSSSADLTLCPSGSGAAQCSGPAGVAVDESNGHVYVVDRGNNRINVFDSSGTFLTSFGSPGTGAGQFTDPQAIAVDNDPASPGFHDVYVLGADLRVQRFSPSGDFILTFGGNVNQTKVGTGASSAQRNVCTAISGDTCGAGVAGSEGGRFNSGSDPIDVGPGGTVYVGDATETFRIEKFEPSGTFLSQVVLPRQPAQLAVDSIGDFYVYYRGDERGIRKYDAGGTLQYVLDEGIETNALDVDSTDRLFAEQCKGGGISQCYSIAEYSPSGVLTRRFGYGSINPFLNDIAVYHGTAGDVFGSSSGPEGGVLYLKEPPPSPLSCCQQPLPGNTKATLKSVVNPEGKATTYHFEYLTDADFKANGNDFTGPKPAISTPESSSIGSDFELHDVEAQIGCAKPEIPVQASCLLPVTDYHYRLVAKNEDGESIAAGQFETKPPFEILDTFATEVGTDAARVKAAVNPLGIPTTGYFEYVENSAYQADIEAGGDGFAAAAKAPDLDSGQSPLDLGAGEGRETAGAMLSGLEPDTTYRYRIVVADPFAEDEGPTRTLVTFPVPKQPSVSCPNAAFRTGPSAILPECRAFEMVSPVDKNGGDIKVLGNVKSFPARLEQSAADGGRFAFSSVTAFGGALSAPWSSQYLATREAGVGWSTEAINAPRESTSLTNNNFIRLDAPFKAFDESLSSGWLLQDANPSLDPCAPAGFPGLYRRDAATGAYEVLSSAKPLNQSADQYVLELQGISADGTHSIFRANAKLTPDASGSSSGEQAVFQLYEHIKGEGCGELRLVSVLPNGKASALQNSAGTSADSPGEFRANRTAQAVSTNGSRIFWTATPVGFDKGPLYVRVDGQKTIQISAGSAQFWTAAADGSRAIFSVGKNLFEFEVDKALAGEPASTLIAGGLPIGTEAGVAAASGDASRVYFVSTEALGGQGEAGEPNLYLHEASGPTSYVATLNGSDPTLPGGGDLSPNFSDAGFAVALRKPIGNGVRVTPDGAHLAFVSTGSLTGYDNTDAADGRPDLEIYLYDAESGNLACVSCNPSGARPAGRAFGPLGVFTRRVAAQMPPGENQLFFPRVLSEDGNRLFFESFEALLPRDVNGRADVYEWQRASDQSECDERGAELYVPASGGCLSLISSGQSPVDSEIADASPDGSDVFIRTTESLLPQDPGQVDVYDARVNGGFPPPPAQPAACEGEACQGPLASPEDPTPASSAFHGPGNVKPAKPRPCPKGKVRRKGRCVTKRHARKHKHRKHHRQANDKRRAGR